MVNPLCVCVVFLFYYTVPPLCSERHLASNMSTVEVVPGRGVGLWREVGDLNLQGMSHSCEIYAHPMTIKSVIFPPLKLRHQASSHMVCKTLKKKSNR